jgi:hypothetical protein
MALSKSGSYRKKHARAAVKRKALNADDHRERFSLSFSADVRTAPCAAEGASISQDFASRG